MIRVIRNLITNTNIRKMEKEFENINENLVEYAMAWMVVNGIKSKMANLAFQGTIQFEDYERFLNRYNEIRSICHEEIKAKNK